ncbi:MAG: shikimate dehydrogenase [Bacteroidetes bacterium]|jgi:shikimate dehydrogenase|nr:shikimate dehydrogenase [Bacteroidota bacterium]
MLIDGETRLLTLMGDPVAHSRSPFIHNTALQHQGHNMVYVTTRVEAGEVREAVAGLRALHVAGANVTIPHKEAVLPFLDAVHPRAKAVGAVNTIVAQPDRTLRGDNTDVVGFLEPLAPYRAALQGASVIILGAGGAARAAAYALLTTFGLERLTLAARRPDQAEHLAAHLAPHDASGTLHVVPLDRAGQLVRQAKLVVNATPVGMHPRTDATPWPAPGDFTAEHLVYDLIYNPRETRLLQEAAAQGATPIGGLGMLIGQAAAAYEQWTGAAMPVKVVREALRTS